MSLIMRTDSHSVLLAPVHAEIELASEDDLVCAAAGSSLKVDLVICMGLARSFPLSAAGESTTSLAPDLLAILLNTSAQPGRILERRLVRGLHAPPGSPAGKAKRALSEFWQTFRGSQWEKALLALANRQGSASSRETLLDIAHLVPTLSRVSSAPAAAPAQRKTATASPMAGKGSALRTPDRPPRKSKDAHRTPTGKPKPPASPTHTSAGESPIHRFLEMLRRLGVQVDRIQGSDAGTDYLSLLSDLFALIERP